MKKEKYINIICKGIAVTINPFDVNLLMGFFECTEIGDKFEIEIIELTQEEFKKLPAFEGF